MGKISFWHGTKAQYDAITSKSTDTLYCTSDGGIFKGSARLTLPPAFGEYLDRNGQVLRITETYGTNPAKQIFSIARRNANESYFALSRVTTATGSATTGLETGAIIESNPSATSFIKSNLVVGGVVADAQGKLTVVGSLVTTGGVTMLYSASSSDRRLKQPLNDVRLSLEELEKIPATRFTWKNTADQRAFVGTMAQDVQKVLPEVVFENTQGHLSVDYGTLATTMAVSLVEEVKELKTTIEQYQQDLQEKTDELLQLRSELSQLRSEIAQLKHS